MRKLTYFFSVVGMLAILTFIYDLTKLNFFDWTSLAIATCMIFAARRSKIVHTLALKKIESFAKNRKD